MQQIMINIFTYIIFSLGFGFVYFIVSFSVINSIKKYKKDGHTARRLIYDGYKIRDLKKAGFTAKDFKDSGFLSYELEAARFTAKGNY